MTQFEVVGLLGIGREQGFVGQHIDTARQAAGDLSHARDQRGGKQIRAAIARHRQARAQISAHFIGVERRQIQTQGDAVLELADARVGQHDVQLGLAEQNNLQQFIGRGFEIGQ